MVESSTQPVPTKRPECRCARPDCQNPGRSSCSNCKIEFYCGIDCQKTDWKKHRPMCSILKKLSIKKQPYFAAFHMIQEILASKEGNNMRVLEHVLSFVENLYGKQILGMGIRESEDGQSINNYDVEIALRLLINSRMGLFYSSNESLSAIVRDEKMFPSLERSLSLLTPWLVHLDSDINNGSGCFPDVLMVALLQELLRTEQGLVTALMNKGQFDEAEGHCQRLLSYSKKCKVDGENKTTAIYGALCTYVGLRQRQRNIPEAVTFAEEAYIVVSGFYDPVHPHVQAAAASLIECLKAKGDLYNAERFAEANYSILRDPKNGINQESDEVAESYYNLADIINKQMGDLEKAEKLARDSLNIRIRLFDSTHFKIGDCCFLLSRILRSRKNLGDETKDLLTRSLAIFFRNEGKDGANTAEGNIRLGEYHYHVFLRDSKEESSLRVIKLLILAKEHLEEGCRIESLIYGPNNPATFEAIDLLAAVMCNLT
mmetsp:Transcript_26947/g.25802  ORF Transcript_26947/g.25802 Transcript_26947/m.25802 type:complete len:487 (+) Transcript_26947:111-1571(+)